MPSSIEIIHPGFPRGGFRAAIFDFDGTLSLLRRNWQDVMIPMMVAVLEETGTTESREALHAAVEEFVMRLNGKQTIYQMIRLAEEVQNRGGRPLEPLAYKHRYHELLWSEVGRRVEAVAAGEVPADEMTVPGSRELLEALSSRGVELFLASGTDLHYVQNELSVLGLAGYFGERVFGALDDYAKFSKAMIIERIIAAGSLNGAALVGFGDGYVEIEEVKRAGGLAVGVASNEETKSGVNAWKRDRLIRAGADLIVPDYGNLPAILQTIGLDDRIIQGADSSPAQDHAPRHT